MSRRVGLVLVSGAGVTVAAWTALAALLMSVVSGGDDATAPPPSAPACVVLAGALGGAPGGGPGAAGRMTAEQADNARVIVAGGRRLGVPPYGWVVALAAALQESGLRNLDYGDRDSLGLFQQRPSQGWGTPRQILDPAYAAAGFYHRLSRVEGWRSMAVTVAAQAVQRSAFPLAYARHEPLAAAIVRRLSGADPGACRQAATGGWLPPVSGFRLTSRFGPRAHPVRGTADFHTGLDFALPAGRPVRAAAGGVVVSAGWGGGYGNLVKIRHGRGVETWYAHLDRVGAAAGDRVAAGSPIGSVGSTGNSTGPHLHLEVRLDGSPVDPVPWLAAAGSDPRA